MPLTIVLHAWNEKLLVLFKGTLEQDDLFITLQEFSMYTGPVLFIPHGGIVPVEHSQAF